MAWLKREFTIFIVLFLFLSLAMHFGAWLNHPLVQIESLPSSPLGVWHPLLITLLVYGVVLILRLLYRLFKRVIG